MDDVRWHAELLPKVLKKLKTQKAGLSVAQVEERRKKFGQNALPKEKPPGRSAILIAQFKSPLVYVLLAAAVISAVLLDWPDMLIIAAAVIVNVVLGYYQEAKANRAMMHLKTLVTFRAKVLRDGREVSVNSTALVPGDVVLLRAGDKITADGRLLDADNLTVIEAALTGESAPSRKTAAELPRGTALADRENMVYSGTVVASGRATVVVCTTGTKTEIGQISRLISETKEEPTPLQRQITSLSKALTMLIVGITGLIVILGGWQGRPIIAVGAEAHESMLLLAAAVAVSAIPEGLLIAITVILAIGMRAILKERALVRRLIATETLGSVSIICTDKTGTLTEGRMEVERLITYREHVSLNHGSDYRWAPDGGGRLKDHELITKISLLCSNATIENPEEQLEDLRIIGDPTEAALAAAGLRAGITRLALERLQPRLGEITFNSERKWMATWNRLDAKRNVIYIKGAPEKLLRHARFIRIDGQREPLTASRRAGLKRQYEQLTGQGLRLLAFSYRQVSANVTFTDDLTVLEGATVVGFAALKDPLRPEAKEMFRLTRQAGIRPIIVTGDHRLTAEAIVAELGLAITAHNVIEGADLDALSDEELQARVAEIDVYARVEPRHKLRIINAWQQRGEVVAMTGDGVNDAPALKAADVGLALGSGTDVAKETADIILLDDNFKTIVTAVERGRVIFENIRKVVLYLLSDSFSEIILITGALLLKLPMPILPAQILWINVIDDGLPGLALTNEPGEREVMADKPRPKTEPILKREVKTVIAIIGIVTNILLLGFFWLLHQFSNYDLTSLRTMLFTILAIDSLLYVFSCRSLRHSVLTMNPLTNKFLLVGVAVGVLLQLLAVYEPHLQRLLDTVALGPTEWLIVLGLASLNLLAIELTKHYFITKKRMGN